MAQAHAHARVSIFIRKHPAFNPRSQIWNLKAAGSIPGPTSGGGVEGLGVGTRSPPALLPPSPGSCYPCPPSPRDLWEGTGVWKGKPTGAWEREVLASACEGLASPPGGPTTDPSSGGEGQLASTGHRDEVHEARVCEVCGVRCDCEAPSTRGGRNEGGPGRGPRRGPMGETSISGPALQAPDQIMPPRQD